MFNLLNYLQLFQLKEILLYYNWRYSSNWLERAAVNR